MRIVVVLSMVLVRLASAQDHFEVASVKPSPVLQALPNGGMVPPTVQGGPGTPNPRQINYRGVTLGLLLVRAYGVKSNQVSAPIRLDSDRYDVVANVPEGATQEQLKVMLQNLLIERFNLKLHHESKIVPVYALVIGKNGPKLKESATGSEPPAAPPSGIGKAEADGFPALPAGYTGVVGLPSNGRMHLAGQRVGLSKLTPWLENQLDHPVVDETGLTGSYDFRLEFEWMVAGRAASDTAADPAPSVFSAVENQLGLKLEAKKIATDILVIDRIDREPTAN